MRLQLLPRDKRISQYRVTSVCKVVTSRSSALGGLFIPHEHCQGQPPFKTLIPPLSLSLSFIYARLFSLWFGSSKNQGPSSRFDWFTITLPPLFLPDPCLEYEIQQYVRQQPLLRYAIYYNWPLYHCSTRRCLNCWNFAIAFYVCCCCTLRYSSKFRHILSLKKYKALFTFNTQHLL